MKRIKHLKTRDGEGTHSISQDESVLDAANKFIDGNVGALVVYDGEKMVGIFTKNDLVRCCARHATGMDTLKIEQYMTRNPVTASIDDNLDDVTEMMIKKGFHHVPVTERGRAVGMLTPVDIVEYEKHLLDAENKELTRYIRGSY